MDLHFANPSRSYDPTRHAVRFWGYDRSMEVSFFVAEDALFRLQPSIASKDSDFLEAFDAHRDRICKIAAKVYARGPKGSYDLRRRIFEGSCHTTVTTHP
jgi:hypothetical protein